MTSGNNRIRYISLNACLEEMNWEGYSPPKEEVTRGQFVTVLRGVKYEVTTVNGKSKAWKEYLA